jgi:hypothetical protein
LVRDIVFPEKENSSGQDLAAELQSLKAQLAETKAQLEIEKHNLSLEKDIRQRLEQENLEQAVLLDELNSLKERAEQAERMIELERRRADSERTLRVQSEESVCGGRKELEAKLESLNSQLRMRETDVKSLQEQVLALNGNAEDLKTVSSRMLTQILQALRHTVVKIQTEMERRKDLGSSDLCVVCMESKKTILIMPCNHLCLCFECSRSVSDKCPMCRSPVENKIKVFR